METDLITGHLMPLLSKYAKSTQLNFNLLESFQKSTGRVTSHGFKPQRNTALVKSALLD